MKDQKWVYLFIGTVVLILAGALSYNMVDDAGSKWFIVKVILGLGAAAFVVALPGTINVELPAKIQATGSLAIFVLIVFVPKDPIVVPPPAYELITIKGRLETADDSKFTQDVTFTIAPTIEWSNDGSFTIGKIAKSKDESIDNVWVTIHKPGYQPFNIKLDDLERKNSGYYTLNVDVKDKNLYRINKDSTIRLHKMPVMNTNTSYNPNGNM